MHSYTLGHDGSPLDDLAKKLRDTAFAPDVSRPCVGTLVLDARAGVGLPFAAGSV
jgi:hypothetical protein